MSYFDRKTAIRPEILITSQPAGVIVRGALRYITLTKRV